MNYILDLKNYIPICEQEIKDKEVMLKFIDKYGDFSLDRKNDIAHFSASAWVINKTHDKVLLNFHNIYKNWGWLGGHADNEPDLLKRATLEVMEEAGIKNFKPLLDKAISVEILPVPYHIKNNKFVNSHLHLNLTYLFEADESEKLTIKPDENSGLKWVYLDDAIKLTNEEAMKPIYQKLNDFIRKSSLLL